MKLAPIPEAPTRAQVEQALRRIFSIIGEFPYVSQADRANTLGLLLTPLLRYAFSGHVPLALVDAPKQGTGKGLENLKSTHKLDRWLCKLAQERLCTCLRIGLSEL